MNYPITADDFGLHEQSIKATLAMITAKQVRRASILVNLPSSIPALAHCQQFPNVEWGIHLNIIEGKPVSSASEVPSLVDQNGNFYSLPILIGKLYFNQINLHEVELEFERQIRILQPRSTIQHINSHQNLHVFPPFWFIVESLAKKYNIPQIRQSSSIVRRLQRFPLRYIVYWTLWILLWHKFGRHHHPEKSNFEETLIHPGTNYD